jgi:hypothetical protein
MSESAESKRLGKRKSKDNNIYKISSSSYTKKRQKLTTRVENLEAVSELKVEKEEKSLLSYKLFNGFPKQKPISSKRPDARNQPMIATDTIYNVNNYNFHK